MNDIELARMTRFNRLSKVLLDGGEVSAVMLDPTGLEFPRSWYAHMLRYVPGQGLRPGSINKAYLSPSVCDCDAHVAQRRARG